MKITPAPKKRIILTLLFSAFLAAFCAVFFLSNLQKPLLNWDMIAYVASAKAYQTHDPGVLQAEVYGLLRDSVPLRTYSDLTSGHLRHLRATDPESFRQHLPFFQIRVAYIWTIFAFWAIGLNPFFVSYLISAACASLALIVLATLALPGRPLLPHVLVLPLVARSSGFLEVVCYSTPDAMALLVVLLCYALVLRPHKGLLVLLPLSLTVRTDLAILVAFFYAYLWSSRSFSSQLIVLSAVASMAVYLGLHAAFHAYGWATVFDYTLTHQTAYPGTYPHHVTPTSYLTALSSGLTSVENLRGLLQYVGVTIAAILVLRLRPLWIEQAVGPYSRPLLFAFASSLGYVLLHFVLFPVTWTRFFVAEFALTFSLAAYLALALAIRTLSLKIHWRPTALAPL